MTVVISTDANTIMITSGVEEYERLRAHILAAFPNYKVIHFQSMLSDTSAPISQALEGKFTLSPELYDTLRHCLPDHTTSQNKAARLLGKSEPQVEVTLDSGRGSLILVEPRSPGKTIGNIGDLLDAARVYGELPHPALGAVHRTNAEFDVRWENIPTWLNPRQLGKTRIVNRMLADKHRSAKVVAKERVRALNQHIDTTYIGNYPTGTIPKRTPFDAASLYEETLSFIIPCRGSALTKRIDLDKRNCKERAYTELASKAKVIYHCVWHADRLLKWAVFKA